MESTLQLLLAATVAVAAVIDTLRERIPNWLTLSAALLGIVLHTLDGGMAGFQLATGGLLAGFGLMIGFYAMGGMGAGDVKLLAAVGAFAGPWRVIWIFFYTALFGGVYASGIVVYSLIAEIGWSGVARRLKAEGTALVLTAGEVKPSAKSLRRYPKLRYAIAVAVGVAVEHYVGALRF